MERLDDNSISELRAGGLRVLWEGAEPKVDIVAVHGLGANPDWAWVYKVKDKNGEPVLNDQGKPKLVNWLKDSDMLPVKLPQARIMTFNYLSKWHANAPVQRLALCAEQMIDAIHTLRRQEPDSEYRPLVFVGHSYGGIVVQQALVFAEGNSDHRYLSIATIGVISLGTPFRGSAVTPWAEMIARTGNILGFGSSKDILEDLREDSVRLTDLRHHFALWLFRQSVPVYCFFEQFLTDYGKRFGLTWKEKVVDENSACLDGHHRYTLPTDHLKMNKFEGPHNLSYLHVMSKLIEIVREESKKVEQRRNPLRAITGETDWTPDHNLLMRDLCLTDPVDDLAAVKRAKGERVKGTCEWILTRVEYTRWLTDPQKTLLFIVGGPGIGKTMIAAYLSDELMRKAAIHHGMAFAYYFCDNKDHTRSTAVGILRGILLQLLRQRPALSDIVLREHKQKSKGFFENFDALCRILRSVLSNPVVGEAYVLVDALDECVREQHHDILDYFKDISTSGYKVKLLITSRPIGEITEIDRLIKSSQSRSSEIVRIDSGTINTDLASFIDNAVMKLPATFPESTKTKIRNVLTDQAGGTFLWTSLVLKDISKTKRMENVDQKLRTLPKGLNEVYIKILQEVDEEDVEDARFILKCMTAASRPLTVPELAVARMVGRGYWKGPTAPNMDDIREYEAGWQCCGAFLRVDLYKDTQTINFIHQSVKDFLLDKSSRKNDTHGRYSFILAEAHCSMFEVCRNYLMSPSFDHVANEIVAWCETDLLLKSGPWYNMEPFQGLMLGYSARYWLEHAMAAPAAEWQMGNKLSCLGEWLSKRPNMPGSCSRHAAREGRDKLLHRLLEMGVDINSSSKRDGTTALHLAAAHRRVETVRLLLENPDVDAQRKDFQDSQPITIAARAGQWLMVNMLIASQKCDINAVDLFDQGTILHTAAMNGVASTICLLLAQKDILQNTSGYLTPSPLALAASNGHKACMDLLHAQNVGVDGMWDIGGRMPLILAAMGGHIPCMEQLILWNDVDIDTKDAQGRTPLSWAAGIGHKACVELLLARSNVDPNKSDRLDRTPLSYAAEGGHVSCVNLLISRKDVVAQSRDTNGWTPLDFVINSNTQKLGCYRWCLEILLARADVTANYYDKHGHPPLYWAACTSFYCFTHGDDPIMGKDYLDYLASLEILAAKSDKVIDARDARGRTILSSAAEAWNEPCLKVLLRRSTELINIEDESGRTPLAWTLRSLGQNAELRNKDNFNVEPFLKATEQLVLGGADINHPSVRAEMEKLDVYDYCRFLANQESKRRLDVVFPRLLEWGYRP